VQHTDDLCPIPCAQAHAKRQKFVDEAARVTVVASRHAAARNGGRYEDVYVRTAGGWKFKARRVVMPAAP
jgi:hypothetical protein